MPTIPENQQYIVRIESVDTTKKIANVVDRTGGQIGIVYSDPNSAALSVPKEGELWMAIRNGYVWNLSQRYETGEESIKDTELQPGDTRVGSEGNLYLIGDKVFVNKDPLGLMTWERFNIPTGGLWQVVLEHTPISIKTVQAFNNEKLIDPSLLTFVNDVLIGKPKVKFSEGSLIIYYQYQP